VETLAAAGHYRPEELAAILRYYFNGTNLLLEQGAWESMLTGCGFDWRIQPCCGKAWYRYYLVYACHPRMS
jgi:hypothetical protein